MSFAEPAPARVPVPGRGLLRSKEAWWVVAVVAVCVLARIAYWRVAIGEDTAGYLYVGDTILHGGMPYADAAEPKGPVLHLLFAVIDLVAGTSAVAVRATLLPFVVTAALAVGLWVRTFTDRATGWIAALAMAALGAMAPYEGFDPNSEQYGVGLMTLAWLLATIPALWAPAAVGALIAAAIGMNLGFAPVVVPIAITLWPTARRLGLGRTALAALGGAALVAGPVVAWLAIGGALGDAKHQVWDFARHWSAGTFALAPVRGSGIREFLTAPAGAFWFLGLVSAAVAAVDRDLRRPALACGAWIVAMYVRVKLNRGYEYPHHYYPGIPGIVAAVVLGVHAVTRAAPARRALAATLVLALPVWTYVVAPEWAASGQSVTARGSRFALAYPMAKYIDAHTRARDPIFVAGSEAEVYWLSGRRAPTRWFVNYVLYVYPQEAAERRADLRRHPPAAIAAIAPETPADLVGTDVQELIDALHYRKVFDEAGGMVWLRPDRVPR